MLAPPLPPARPSIGRALPGYDVQGELGRGGMGVVFAGRHRQLGRAVAIKELPAALAGDAAVRSRFLAEARILAALDHPHIVPVYDFTEADGKCLLVMEHLPGGTVWDQFQRDGFAAPTVAAIAMVTCAALQYSHEHGILHRDIKPENLLFSTSRVLKVTDFGIARVLGGGETLATSAGEILGTPAYMAPEQAEGTALSPATDVYATGVMLYELLSGRLPYSGDGGALAIVFRHVYEEPTPLGRVAPDVHPALATVVMQALARRAEDRFSSAEDFGVAIGEAAAQAWGSGWLSRSGMALMSSARMLASTERHGVVVGFNGDNATVGGLAPPPPPRPPRVDRVVRPALGHRPAAQPIMGLDESPLVPVRDVLQVPSRPVGPGLVGAALLVAAGVLALTGIGAAPAPAAVPPGTLSVQGTDAGAVAPIPLDLTQPVPITITHLPPGAEKADAVRLDVSVLGSPPLHSNDAPLTRDATGAHAEVTPAAARYVAAGTFDASLVLLDNRQEVGAIDLTAKRTGSGLLTAAALAAIAATTLALAYVEGFLRSLRRRRRAPGALVGVAPAGALLGIGALALAWVFAGTVLSPATIVACAVTSAAGCVALGVTAARWGRRRRAVRLAAKTGNA
jgi:serine/threonine-protein kinase